MSKPPRLLLRSLVLLLAVGLCLDLARPAPARADDALQLNLCKQVLARMLCKKTNEFSYVGKMGEGVYILGVFYGSKNSEFLCAALPDGQLVLQDRTWHATRRVFAYEPDGTGKCITVNYSNPECPTRAALKSCPPKMDAKEAAKETFWSRPIPAILEEEFKAMKGQANATAPAAPPAGAPAETPATGQ
jgi:hypothetical protein